MGEVVHRRIQRIRFRANQHEIEGAANISGENSLRGNSEVAMRADHVKSFTGQLLGTPGAQQECDIASGPDHASTEIAAQSPGADHQNTHAKLVLVQIRPTFVTVFQSCHNLHD